MTKPDSQRPNVKKNTKKSSPKFQGHNVEFGIIFNQSLDDLQTLYNEIYATHPYSQNCWDLLCQSIQKANQERSDELRIKDRAKAKQGHWYLDNSLAGMSLYVDRFCQDLSHLGDKFNYVEDLGINVLHLMPVFRSPAEESDGGYAVSDFRIIEPRYGTLDDLKSTIAEMNRRGMFLMMDIVLNHTSNQHEWAKKARAGELQYMDYYYMYPDRVLPDLFENTLPEIFPESSPGNFTYIPECNRWVMTVFHHYQWDLNFSNPRVFIEMLDNVFFYANLGVDILRIDAPAFIWKQLGTNAQNLPQAHSLLRLIKLAVKLATPGMAILGEAIVAPFEIMKYFGSGDYLAKECDFTYNATMMALRWDALATGKTRVMHSAQSELFEKPLGTSWISYTRCHDDIGLGFGDRDIIKAGFDPESHRSFLQEYYTGIYPDSPAKGALFSTNPKTRDARISGTLASLCGLESAILQEENTSSIEIAIHKIILMQAHSFFIGGLPVIYYGDEVGYTNDYSYLLDPGKNYDNRWMHRPIIDWNKNALAQVTGTTEEVIYTATKRLLQIRKRLSEIADFNNIIPMPDENIHITSFVRHLPSRKLFCIFNFGAQPVYLSWYIFKSLANEGDVLYDHWSNQELVIGTNQDLFQIKGYGFVLAEWIVD